MGLGPFGFWANEGGGRFLGFVRASNSFCGALGLGESGRAGLRLQHFRV